MNTINKNIEQEIKWILIYTFYPKSVRANCTDEDPRYGSKYIYK